jgi:hypothetical protein
MRDTSQAPYPVKTVQEGKGGGRGTLALVLTGYGTLLNPARAAHYPDPDSFHMKLEGRTKLRLNLQTIFPRVPHMEAQRSSLLELSGLSLALDECVEHR